MHTPVTADIVAEVFQWSRDTDHTMTQPYTAFTCAKALSKVIEEIKTLHGGGVDT